jgi:hypothetical protein
MICETMLTYVVTLRNASSLLQQREVGLNRCYITWTSQKYAGTNNISPFH